MHTVPQKPGPGPWQLFRIWAGIGLQSFGGGASTLYLIQREFVDRRDWLTMEDFIHQWSLCVMTPGINLLALTILIGHRLCRAWGVFVSLAGLLLPSALITCLIAAGLKEIEHLAAVQAVVKGIIPATAGIMLLVGLRFAQPQAKQAYQEGFVCLAVCLALVLLCFIAIAVLNISVALILPCAGLLGIALFGRLSRRKPQESTAHD